jgi:hypothetical protein
MVLEYIVSKPSEENFVTVVGGHCMMPAPSNKVRRLSMQSSGSKHGNSTKGPFTSHANPKYFLFHPSHQIFKRMYGALNVGKKNN